MLCITLLWYPAPLKSSCDVCVWPIKLVALTTTVFLPDFALNSKLHGLKAYLPRSSPSFAVDHVLPPSVETSTARKP